MKVRIEINSLKTPEVVKFSEKISKTAIYLLTFLIPIFFLPWTLDTLDFNKQFLMGILVTIALISWLVKALASGKLEFNLNFLNIPVLIFLLVYGISTIFSYYRYGSFWGWPLNVSQGFLTLLYFLILYFLVSNIFTEKKEISWLFFFLFFSGFLVTIFSIFQIFGKISFNLFGSLNSFSIFLASLLPLVILLAVISKWLIRFFLTIFAISFLIFLILVNFGSAWIILIAGTSIIFIFGLLKFRRTGESQLVFISIFLLIFSLFFLIFRISLPIEIPAEVLLSQRTGFQIARDSLKNIKKFFLGTGPSTFIFNYSKFKPIEINQTAFWNIRFNSGASEILDKLTTIGILGILSLLSIFFLFSIFGFKNLTRQIEERDFLISLAIFSSFFSLIFSQFLYPVNFSLLFFFWLILGAFLSLNQKIKVFTFSPSSLIPAISLVLIFLFGIGLTFLLIKNYLAEIKYLSGLKTWREGKTEKAISEISGAIDLNSGLDIYFRDISQLYLERLNEILQRRDLSPEEIQNQSQILITNAINSAVRTTEISPNNVANWDIRGFIYRNLIELVSGTENWAIKSYEEAIKLEPQSPYIFNEIGLVFLAKADLLSRTGGQEKEISENLNKAKDNFQKAIELKLDYPSAHFQLAMIYQREGKTKEAISKFEETKLIAPFDSGLAFQLGLLYYNNNQFDLAKGEFERAVRIDESYSNARYFLGLIYDKEGKKDLAIEQFERIEKLNPENLEVKKILENLREGKRALEGIIPGLPPIEEKVPERRP